MVLASTMHAKKMHLKLEPRHSDGDTDLEKANPAFYIRWPENRQFIGKFMVITILYLVGFYPAGTTERVHETTERDDDYATLYVGR